MKSIKVLGPGCAKCKTLYDLVQKAANQMGIEYSVEKVTDIDKFVAYGVMLTPALVVNEEVVLVGSVPSVDRLMDLIGKE